MFLNVLDTLEKDYNASVWMGRLLFSAFIVDFIKHYTWSLKSIKFEDITVATSWKDLGTLGRLQLPRHLEECQFRVEMNSKWTPIMTDEEIAD